MSRSAFGVTVFSRPRGDRPPIAGRGPPRGTAGWPGGGPPGRGGGGGGGGRGAARGGGGGGVISGPSRPWRGGVDLEVVVGGRPLLQEPWDGERRVEVIAGSEYELRLTNPLPGRVAVAVSVDGLNVIDGRRTGAREASKWVVH